MDSFELNKIVGAFLAVVFVMFSVTLLSDAIFAAHAPEKPGFIVEAAEEDAGGGAAAPAAEVPIATLLQDADPAAGETVFKRCAACHTDDKSGANKTGPNLWNIVNRPVASHEGFTYSGPMKEFAQGGSVVWDYEHLNHFLMAPKSLVPGTAMTFAGLKADKDRANVIAYLRTTADSPAPLPEPAAAEAPAEGAAPQAGSEPAAPGQPAPVEQPTEGQAEPKPAQ
jgi:cytochrome c